jgi:hypothetical protein
MSIPEFILFVGRVQRNIGTGKYVFFLVSYQAKAVSVEVKKGITEALIDLD